MRASSSAAGYIGRFNTKLANVVIRRHATQDERMCIDAQQRHKASYSIKTQN